MELKTNRFQSESTLHFEFRIVELRKSISHFKMDPFFVIIRTQFINLRSDQTNLFETAIQIKKMSGRLIFYYFQQRSPSPASVDGAWELQLRNGMQWSALQIIFKILYMIVIPFGPFFKCRSLMCSFWRSMFNCKPNSWITLLKKYYWPSQSSHFHWSGWWDS